MTRRTRERQTGWFHVVNRGADRGDIFRTERDAVGFLAILGEAASETGVEVHAYCLLRNHYHLLLHAPSGGLSAAMKRLGGKYTQVYNRRHGRDGPLFRGRFYSKPICDDQYLDTVGWYIHRNGFAAVGDRPVEIYRWSSLRSYLGLQPAPSWLNEGRLLTTPPRTAAEYRAFIYCDRVNSRQTVSSVEWAVSTAIEEADSEGLARCAGQVRDLIGPDLPPPVRRAMMPVRSEAAARRSSDRAARRYRCDPDFRSVVQQARRLLGLPGTDNQGQV